MQIKCLLHVRHEIPMSPLLPFESVSSGWKAYTDSNSSRIYYVYLPTAETQWTRPLYYSKPLSGQFFIRLLLLIASIILLFPNNEEMKEVVPSKATISKTTAKTNYSIYAQEKTHGSLYLEWLNFNGPGLGHR